MIMILEMKNVIKRREQGGITFELQIPEIRLLKGQFVAIVGNSGCGKKYIIRYVSFSISPK